MFKKISMVSLAGALFLCVGAGTVFAAREGVEKGGAEGLEASRLFDKAKELLEAKETERGVKLLETIQDQYPKSRIKYKAALLLGNHYIDKNDYIKAIENLNKLRDLSSKEAELSSEDRELYLEGQYRLGVVYFQLRRYDSVFPILRKITTQYANSIWANQAYYYIGMCHFAQRNWGKAIEALNMVGLFIDANSPDVNLAEAGQRIYFKAKDADLPILRNLGIKCMVKVSTASGDQETAECIPAGGQVEAFIGSLPTECGVAKPKDGIIQLIGGDTIHVEYVDLNTLSGSNNVARSFSAKVISSATLLLAMGDGETRAGVAYLEQPVVVVMNDLDLDRTEASDSAQVKVFSRYKEEVVDEGGTTKSVDVDKLLKGDLPNFKVRDQIVLTLEEMGEKPVHSGRFTGKFIVAPVKSISSAAEKFPVLRCAVGDEIIVQYTDEVNLQNNNNRIVEAGIPVAGEIDNAPKASQDIVADPGLKARKYLVEATAYLELAKIFQSMGLIKGAKEKAVEGVERVDDVIKTLSPIPDALRQDAFKLKWELYMASDDMVKALGTCNTFIRLYPDSLLADEALMGIARIKSENREFQEVANIYKTILSLPRSDVKPEAAFRLAELTEQISNGRNAAAAISQYKQCAERFPDSEYAGRAMGKVVDYYITTKDYAQADSILEQIFQDYPDAKFLDSMILKSVLVAFSSGDYQKARDKCSQILSQYPNSSAAVTAKKLMPKIDAQFNNDSGKAKISNEK